jgi:hypothetical protein
MICRTAVVVLEWFITLEGMRHPMSVETSEPGSVGRDLVDLSEQRTGIYRGLPSLPNIIVHMTTPNLAVSPLRSPHAFSRSCGNPTTSRFFWRAFGALLDDGDSQGCLTIVPIYWKSLTE